MSPPPKPSRALKTKATKIGRILDELFPDPEIPLDHSDPFTFLCAVLLSAQTTDKKVNEVTPALFAMAPTPAAMADLEVETIQHLIREIGLAPTKAKHLKAMSRLLIERHGGQVPRTFEELEALPGVGHKTASVLMSQAFGFPAFAVDTHIHRLAARWGLSDGSTVERTERDLKAVFPEDEWNRRHLQIIYFGRAHCPARGHIISACPVCSWGGQMAAVDNPADAVTEAARPARPVQAARARAPSARSSQAPAPPRGRSRS
jgi:endonuclease-3